MIVQNMRAKTTESINSAAKQHSQSTEIQEDAHRIKWIVEGCFAEGCRGGGGGGIVEAVILPTLWIV